MIHTPLTYSFNSTRVNKTRLIVHELPLLAIKRRHVRVVDPPLAALGVHPRAIAVPAPPTLLGRRRVAKHVPQPRKDAGVGPC